jgi:hypothetical protein
MLISELRNCHEPIDRIWSLLGLMPDELVPYVQQAGIIDCSDAGRSEYWRSYMAFMQVLYSLQDNVFHGIMLASISKPKNSHLPP